MAVEAASEKRTFRRTTDTPVRTVRIPVERPDTRSAVTTQDRSRTGRRTPRNPGTVAAPGLSGTPKWRIRLERDDARLVVTVHDPWTGEEHARGHAASSFLAAVTQSADIIVTTTTTTQETTST